MCGWNNCPPLGLKRSGGALIGQILGGLYNLLDHNAIIVIILVAFLEQVLGIFALFIASDGWDCDFALVEKSPVAFKSDEIIDEHLDGFEGIYHTHWVL